MVVFPEPVPPQIPMTSRFATIFLKDSVSRKLFVGEPTGPRVETRVRQSPRRSGRFAQRHSGEWRSQATSLHFALLHTAGLPGRALFDHGLRRREPRDRNPKRRRADIIHLHFVTELHA